MCVQAPPGGTALEQTYLAYRELMYRLAWDILQNPQDAEDAVSDALIRLMEHYDCLHAPVGPQTRRFVAVLTEHAAIDLWRRRKRAKTLPLEQAEQLAAPSRDLDAKLDLWAAVERLPNDQRTALLLSLGCELSARETAGILGFSQAKTEKLISRGRKKLREILKEVD